MVLFARRQTKGLGPKNYFPRMYHEASCFRGGRWLQIVSLLRRDVILFGFRHVVVCMLYGWDDADSIHVRPAHMPARPGSHASFLSTSVADNNTRGKASIG